MPTEDEIMESMLEVGEALAKTKEYRKVNERYKSNVHKLWDALGQNERKHLYLIGKSVECLSGTIAEHFYMEGFRKGKQSFA
jgi:ABC-type Fe3+-citrate transport system substrate-binding protein